MTKTTNPDPFPHMDTRKRGKPYVCARCLAQHAPADKDDYVYSGHKLYAEGTEAGESIKTLRAWLKPGDTVYTDVVKVARSGMSRHLRVIIIRADAPLYLTYHVARALGLPMDKRRDSFRIGGCGMDMGFEAVYQLSAMLWPGGDGKYVSARNGDTRPETDGGYLLKQRWL